MKHPSAGAAALLAAAVSLSACVPPVMAPTVPVMPGSGKNFGAFAADQATCEQYANAQVAPLAAQANNRTLGTAVLGTALGAGLGAAIGGGRGAAIGAAGGAIAGTGFAASSAQMAGMGIQQQYNIFYSQCMYGRGNQVPGFAPAQYGLSPYPGGPAAAPYAGAPAAAPYPGAAAPYPGAPAAAPYPGAPAAAPYPGAPAASYPGGPAAAAPSSGGPAPGTPVPPPP